MTFSPIRTHSNRTERTQITSQPKTNRKLGTIIDEWRNTCRKCQEGTCQRYPHTPAQKDFAKLHKQLSTDTASYIYRNVKVTCFSHNG